MIFTPQIIRLFHCQNTCALASKHLCFDRRFAKVSVWSKIAVHPQIANQFQMRWCNRNAATTSPLTVKRTDCAMLAVDSPNVRSRNAAGISITL